MHGGNVSVHSAGAGRGTEFAIRLPAAAACVWTPPSAIEAIADAPPPGVVAPARPEAGNDAKRRMLLVDDNQDALMSLANLLSLDGHEVRTAADGFLALEAAPEFRPEVAVLDIGMPGMDGYELARRIRRSPGAKTWCWWR